MNKDYVVALDVGGTSIKSGIVSNRGELVGDIRRTLIDSQGAADTILETFASIVQSHLLEQDGQSVLGVGVGFPGPFEYETGVSRIQGVAKYETIYNVNVGDSIRQRLAMPELPIRFRNDAEAAIVGEGVFGAGKPFSRVIGVTLGTGCGSAFLVNGRSVTTGAGVPPNGWLYPIPFQGQQADAVFSIRGLMGRLQSAGVYAPDIKTAADLARQDHATAQQVFAKFGQDLGVVSLHLGLMRFKRMRFWCKGALPMRLTCLNGSAKSAAIGPLCVANWAARQHFWGRRLCLFMSEWGQIPDIFQEHE